MTSPILAKGQNVRLPDDVVQIDVVIGWSESEIEVDASALLLRGDGKVGADSDFIFYNQPESPDGSVRFLGTSATEAGAQARIAIDLSTVSAAVHTVALVGSVGNGTFGNLGKLTLRIVDAAGYSLAEYVTADATSESAFVFGEVYRRGGEWKVRAVGQGWASGLAGLATDFGVAIDEDHETADAIAEIAPAEDPLPVEAEAIEVVSVADAPPQDTAPVTRPHSRCPHRQTSATQSQADRIQTRRTRLLAAGSALLGRRRRCG